METMRSELAGCPVIIGGGLAIGGFLFFLWRGWIAPGWRARLWGIFGLGALQGAVGWWMVASGLTERVNVAPLRLAFHLTLAAVIYAALIWAADRGKRHAIAWAMQQ